MSTANLISILEHKSLLFKSPIHGLNHWEHVARNGLYLSDFTGADKQVVTYFGYLHDCMRENEGIDPRHGVRAAEYAEKNRSLFKLTDDQFGKLCVACRAHTGGRKISCPTIATCWDADRLDIGRVGTTPNSEYLFSNEAKRIADESDFEVLLKFDKWSHP